MALPFAVEKRNPGHLESRFLRVFCWKPEGGGAGRGIVKFPLNGQPWREPWFSEMWRTLFRVEMNVNSGNRVASKAVAPAVRRDWFPVAVSA